MNEFYTDSVTEDRYWKEERQREISEQREAEVRDFIQEYRSDLQDMFDTLSGIAAGVESLGWEKDTPIHDALEKINEALNGEL